jgi:hypothetical protein
MSTLEEALARTQSDAAVGVKAAKDVVLCFKRVFAAAQVGNLKDLPKYLQAAEQGIEGLRQKFTDTEHGWDFDVDTYLSDGSFVSELLEAAGKAQVRVHKLDERLYCYPSLIRLLTDDRMLLIDKQKEIRLRPSVLVEHLRRLQDKPVRFKPEALLKSLRSAYLTARKTRGKGRGGTATVAPLAEIYRLLTLLPGQSKEYSKQEFARDLYLLDQETAINGGNGPSFSLHTASGREPDSKVFATVTKEGEMRRYYGISFTGDE